MGIIGCGIMLAGLLAGALFGGIAVALVVMAIGAILVTGAQLDARQKERQAQAWRKSYPQYRY